MNTPRQDSFFGDEEPLEATTADEVMVGSPASSDGAPETPDSSQALADDSEAPPQALDGTDATPSGGTAARPPSLDPGQAAVDAFFGPPRLDRPRPTRPRLVPIWIPVSLGVLAALIIVGGALWLWGTNSASTSVPQLAGIDVGVARTRLAQLGLELTVSERRFSSRPAQTVLSQTPDAGSKVRRGDTVSVVVSAGTEQFKMPDVVGNGVLLARGRLESKGLQVRVDTTPSILPSNTVLTSTPAAGQLVSTGDTVRITVAAPGPSADLLLPYDMRGVVVVLDPAPVANAQADIPLDVARRVRSLIEASNGTVRTTRALAETSTLDSTSSRASRAADGTATVAVGLSAAASGPGGLIVYAPSPVLPNATASNKLALRLATDLAAEGNTVQRATTSTDVVLSAAKSPWSRIQLGSFSVPADVKRFSNPDWEDKAARAIYRSLGTLYGHKPTTP